MTRLIDLNRGAGGPWHREPGSLAELWRWLREQGREPEDPAYFMERPLKWREEWLQYQQELSEAAAEALEGPGGRWSL